MDKGCPGTGLWGAGNVTRKAFCPRAYSGLENRFPDVVPAPLTAPPSPGERYGSCPETTPSAPRVRSLFSRPYRRRRGGIPRSFPRPEVRRRGGFGAGRRGRRGRRTRRGGRRRGRGGGARLRTRIWRAASTRSPSLRRRGATTRSRASFLDAGVHVLVEKPITVTAEEAGQLVELAEKQGRRAPGRSPRALQPGDSRRGARASRSRASSRRIGSRPSTRGART